MKGKEWIGVIGVVVIVAVVMSLITASITGDVINVRKVASGPSVYTKADIDKKGFTTNENVLKMNLQCDILSVNQDSNCASECNKYGGIGLNTYLYLQYFYNNTPNNLHTFVVTWLYPEEPATYEVANEFLESFSGGKGVMKDYGFGCNCCNPNENLKDATAQASTKFPFG
ncbi:hypothetical protein J4463_03615 [Candidatus Pacearchaeota archaeon]|nr:hypothetical protein [Candidatus Pacearchaeota archaeon]